MNARRTGWILWLCLVLTAAAGVVMRWALAGRIGMPWDFARLRHAHAHLAYYGVLVPLAWWAWRQAGIALPSAWTLLGYGAAVALSIVGFLRAGYAVEAIVGSTVVAGVWLVSAWRARARVRTWDDPLGALLPGMVLALACVPFVARFTRRDPGLAQQWVATFLAGMLLLVVLPSCLSALQVRRPWPALLVAGALGAAALGIWSTPVAGVGLLALALLVFPWRWSVPLHVGVVWALFALGLAAMGVGLVPNTRPVVIGAVHFMALSVCLPSLVAVPGAPLEHRGWWGHHVSVGLLCLPIVLQAFGAEAWTYLAAAVGGTLVLLELVLVGGIAAWGRAPLRR
ncbi:MAG: hypothetical protein EP330_12610 [Deltaproteobacteria bacterium]|nr:MAG: hypothetical protein EP330_12610 [Deltaproteobacteria bacterium]